jgi:hypothetical protein
LVVGEAPSKEMTHDAWLWDLLTAAGLRHKHRLRTERCARGQPTVARGSLVWQRLVLERSGQRLSGTVTAREWLGADAGKNERGHVVATLYGN